MGAKGIVVMIIIVVLFAMYVFYSMGYFKRQAASSLLTTTAVERDSDGDGLYDGYELSIGTDPQVPDSDGDGISDGDEVLKYSTNPLEPNYAFSYALRKLPEGEALIFKGCRDFNDVVRRLIDLYAGLSSDVRGSESVRSFLYTILSDGVVSEKELSLFDDRFVNPGKPGIVGFNFTPVRVINDKVYDVRVSFNVRDDKTGIVYVKLLFIPVEYEYFITKYGMRPEDYGKVFRRIGSVCMS